MIKTVNKIRGNADRKAVGVFRWERRGIRRDDEFGQKMEQERKIVNELCAGIMSKLETYI